MPPTTSQRASRNRRHHSQVLAPLPFLCHRPARELDRARTMDEESLSASIEVKFEPNSPARGATDPPKERKPSRKSLPSKVLTGIARQLSGPERPGKGEDHGSKRSTMAV